MNPALSWNPTASIDFGRPFIPEFITPLAHTDAYSKLTPVQRLRYNQLYASNFHEQFMSLEKVLIEHLGGFPKRGDAPYGDVPFLA